MIPKIIHCCWFGKGDKSDLNKYCIESWKKFLPEYKIMEWSEENFDVNMNLYVKEAYENKCYAFVADYVRLKALYDYGGIYFDMDVEVKMNLDKFLNKRDIYSFESINMVASAVIFSEKHSPIIKQWLDSYENRRFIINGKKNLMTNVYKITDLLKKRGFVMNGETQSIDDITIYEKSYFCPYGIGDSKKNRYDDSYTIHWCEGSWFDSKFKRRIKIIKIIKKVVGTNNYYKILRILKK